MADYREINALAKDPPRARSLAKFLLSQENFARTDWEADFLTAMLERRDELTTRQAEKLVEIRDDSILYTKVDAFVFTRLIETCWCNRFDLDSDEDLAFIEQLKNSGKVALRKSEALRLKRIATELHEIEPHQPWRFPVPSYA